MQPGSRAAAYSKPPRRRALVLGNRAVARLIARGLEENGFETVLEADRRPLASPASPQAWLDLRQLFKTFTEEAGKEQVFHCVHPGATAWAERPELPAIGQELGIEVIGPPSRSLNLFGNRLTLMGEAEELKIPNLLLSPDPLYSVGEIERIFKSEAGNHGFPFVLKTVRGGSTFGVRVVQSEDDFGRGLTLWLEQLRRNLGEVMLLAERYLEGSRRFVVPFARLGDGHVEIFPVSDASLQCRFRKIAQFCPALNLDEPVQKKMQEWTAALAERTGFVGVGVLEFLVDGAKPFLIEGLARLNTDFHLWETVAGTRAVDWQLAAMDPSSGGALPRRKPEADRGFGVALRIYAEDSTLQLPQPGLLREAGEKTQWNFPRAEAELSLAVRVGEEVTPLGHGFVGHLWVFGNERSRAFTVARGVLAELWLAGSLQTNDRFLLDLLSHPWVQEGIFHSGFVDEEFIPQIRPSAELLKIFPAICATHPKVQADSAPSRWAVGDQWIRADAGAIHWLAPPEYWELDGQPGVSGWVEGPEGGPTRLRVCAHPLPIGGDRWQVRVGSWVFSVRRVLTPVSREKKKPPARLLSLVSGKVHSLLYREGAVAAAHEPLVIIESLGMLVPHALPADVRIHRWKCSRDDLIHAGQELALLSLDVAQADPPPKY